jgi:hypothetical protein
VPGDSDEVSVRRGVVRPPPSDAPESVDVPRMEPPPPSLEAMVQRARGAGPEPSRSWLMWLALLVVAAGLVAYVTR